VLEAVVERDLDFLRENLESNLFKKIINFMDNNDKLKIIEADSDIDVKIAYQKYIIGLNIDRSLNYSKSAYKIMDKPGNIDFTFYYPSGNKSTNVSNLLK
jgi:uncharacterized phage protein gp47/JayE